MRSSDASPSIAVGLSSGVKSAINHFMQKRDPPKKKLGLVARVSQNEKLLLLGIGWKLIDIRKERGIRRRSFTHHLVPSLSSPHLFKRNKSPAGGRGGGAAAASTARVLSG
jgi:hypothetical protein